MLRRDPESARTIAKLVANFLYESCDLDAQVKTFFGRLDAELNKVNQFYTAKEGEFLERGESLNKQLEMLLDLKQALSDRRRKSITAGILPRSSSRSYGRSSHESGELPCLCSPYCPSRGLRLPLGDINLPLLGPNSNTALIRLAC